MSVVSVKKRELIDIERDFWDELYAYNWYVQFTGRLALALEACYWTRPGLGWTHRPRPVSHPIDTTLLSSTATQQL